MARKTETEKTLDELNLHEVVRAVGFASTSIGTYAKDANTLKMVLTDEKSASSLFQAVADLKASIAELAKRFNAPSNYRD
jgi:hypothetical protein